ncbi:MAG TPA: hypothetical protein VLN47_08540 [Clostridiaceae bacterium]|nr:hypothetical protein [Clostridiaceae bacterium]
MKSLIVYYSHSGNNEMLAKVLQERMGCPIHRILEVKKRHTISILADFYVKRHSGLEASDVALGDYDQVIFIAPIWGRRVASPMRTFIEAEKGKFSRYHFITLCSGEEGQKEKVEMELLAASGTRPEGVEELWINSLLPEEKRNKVRYTFNYRVDREDMVRFDREIAVFLQQVRGDGR